jgi:asparagine synthase (glutamine-hydrolysing)
MSHNGESRLEAALHSLQQHELSALFLPDIDQMSMAHSIEVRAPYLDREWVEFCSRLPADMKLRGGTGKWLLRQIASRVLAPEYAHRPKQGFLFPLASWLWKDRLGWIEDLLSEERVAARGLFKPQAVRRLIMEGVFMPRALAYHRLWNLLVLEVWMRINLDGDSPFDDPV